MTSPALRGITEAIGGTPLVALDGLVPGCRSRVFAKLEWFNPGGSIKDRTALEMLSTRISSGEVDPAKTTVVESSSGNLGVGLAQLCRYYGMRFVCVADIRTARSNLALIEAYGGRVEMVDQPDPETGEFLAARLRRVRELVASDPHVYWPNQYGNPLNPRAHKRTMREIAEQLDHDVDYLFVAVSTFGTLRGCAQYIQQSGKSTKVIAVDAAGSVILGGQPGRRLLPGHGAGVRSALVDLTLVDEGMRVTDLECVAACRRTVARTGVLAGASSGAVVAAYERLAPKLPDHSTSVLVFPDSGERYLDTVYNDAWVAQNLGELPDPPGLG
ncbi:2,3-diaminopropionate biosynthesis protein SbnA [Streptomyces sp. NPDC054813]